MALVTKQSIVNIYTSRIKTPATALFTTDSGNNPGPTRIDTTKLGTGVFPAPGTAQFNTTLIDGSQINTVFYTYARFITTIRRVRHGFIVDNFKPNTAPTTTDDTSENADLVDGTYKDDSLVPASGIAGTPGTGDLISLANLQTYADNVLNKGNDGLLAARVDLRVCHSSCHNSCHGSRGRR